MKNIIDILKDHGVDVPADQLENINKVVAENYKTVAEYDKKVAKLESERDAQKERADTAEATLKSFDGIDPAKIKNQLDDYQRRAENAEKDYAAKLEQRDFADALDKEMASIKFSSAAAEKYIRAYVEAAGLKLKDGKILGFADLISQLRTADASAFADDGNGTPPPRFTTSASSGSHQNGALTKAEILAIKDDAERLQAIDKHRHLFVKKGNQ